MIIGRTMKIKLLLTGLLLSALGVSAQTYQFDMTKSQPNYTDQAGYGYDVVTAPEKKDIKKAFFFSVKVPDGNYRVTVTLGSSKRAASTVVRAECRRLFLEECVTKKGKYQTFSFLVNKRSPYINNKERVLIKDREREYLHWDDRLTLEFNGSAPAVREIRVERDTIAPTVFLCGNSTVVDQAKEPWASWGQMIPRWFDDQVCFANFAESGLTASSFIAQKRLDKIMSMIKKGDYVLCEFGHNDQKEKGPGAGAYYNFSFALKKFIDMTRKAGATIIFVTPTQRRAWDTSKTKILETHSNYPEAMRAVAIREKVPVIELHDMTRTFFETLGYDNSTKALVHYPANTFPGQTTALADNTHFNQYGAYEVSKMVVMGMKKLQLPIVNNLRNDWKDYNPAQPDDWKTFHWALCPIYETIKPDGN